MAIGDLFPEELVNTMDLRIERPTFSQEWSDESGSPTVLASGLSAIVVPSRRALTREVDTEESPVLADVILNPSTAPAGIQEKDQVTWTDFYGATTSAEVQEIQRFSGVPGLESVVLKVGRRTT